MDNGRIKENILASSRVSRDGLTFGTTAKGREGTREAFAVTRISDYCTPVVRTKGRRERGERERGEREMRERGNMEGHEEGGKVWERPTETRADKGVTCTEMRYFIISLNRRIKIVSINPSKIQILTAKNSASVNVSGNKRSSSRAVGRFPGCLAARGCRLTRFVHVRASLVVAWRVSARNDVELILIDGL